MTSNIGIIALDSFFEDSTYGTAYPSYWGSFFASVYEDVCQPATNPVVPTGESAIVMV
jgi:hypothetical protein